MIKTGCYSQGLATKNACLQKIKNPLWNDDLEGQAWCYDDAQVFSQGSCHLFAYALNEFFGYEIMEIKQGVSCHYFCQANGEDGKVFIDVKGVTTDWEQFIKAIDFISDPNCARIKHYRAELIEELKEDGAEFGYAFAKYIIRTHPCLYDLSYLTIG